MKSCKSSLSIEPANSVTKSPDPYCLVPFIKKGRELRTEQSIMYKTPQKVENFTSLRNLSNVRQHLFSKESFPQNDCTTESIDLTSKERHEEKFEESIFMVSFFADILERIANLSETLNSEGEEKKDTV